MPARVVEFRDTPNPNALKCVIEPAIADAPRSYAAAPDAGADPLAAALFAIPGVTNLLIHESFITVNKAPGAAWKTIKPAVEKALAQAQSTGRTAPAAPPPNLKP